MQSDLNRRRSLARSTLCYQLSAEYQLTTSDVTRSATAAAAADKKYGSADVTDAARRRRSRSRRVQLASTSPQNGKMIECRGGRAAETVSAANRRASTYGRRASAGVPAAGRRRRRRQAPSE